MNEKMFSMIVQALGQTLTMIGVTLVFSLLLGFSLALYLYFVDKGICKRSPLSHLASLAIDGIRSFPFSILIIALLPISKWIFGSSFGLKAALFPMTVAASCYFARLCHQTFHTLPKEMLDVSILMGFSKKDLALRLILKESLPLLIQNIALLSNALLGYSAMAGLVGAGGLGKLAIDYGYYRFNLPILLINISIILVIGKTFQVLGDFWFRKIMTQRGLYGKN